MGEIWLLQSWQNPANPCPPLSPKLKLWSSTSWGDKSSGEIRDITSAPPLPQLIFPLVYYSPILPFRNVFNQHRPLVTNISFEQTRILLPPQHLWVTTHYHPHLCEVLNWISIIPNVSVGFCHRRAQLVPSGSPWVNPNGTRHLQVTAFSLDLALHGALVISHPVCVSLLLFLGVEILISSFWLGFFNCLKPCGREFFPGLGVESGWAAEWGEDKSTSQI